jgi:hypothetical protein
MLLNYDFRPFGVQNTLKTNNNSRIKNLKQDGPENETLNDAMDKKVQIKFKNPLNKQSSR